MNVKQRGYLLRSERRDWRRSRRKRAGNRTAVCTKSRRYSRRPRLFRKASGPTPRELKNKTRNVITGASADSVFNDGCGGGREGELGTILEGFVGKNIFFFFFQNRF